MMLDLKLYPAMKDSRVEWLGEVPAHWEVRRTKQAFRRIVGGSTPSSSEPGYWGGAYVWVTPTDISRTTRIHDSQRRLTRKGLDNCSVELLPASSIIVTSRAPVGNVALARVPFCTNQGCKALVPDNDKINPLFAFNLFGVLQAELQSLANGTTFTEISSDKLGNVRVPLPPLPEQAAIVRYLDYVDRRIQRLMRAKRKLIALLTEQKQAIVHHAVTRGLDPDVPLKDSGVEWLGKVPTHWEVRRLKYWLKINQRVLSETTDPDYEFDYLDIGSVGTGRLSANPERIQFATAPSRARRIVRTGDTIISTVRTYLKAVWHVEEPVCDLIVSTGFAVFTPNRETLPKFVSYLAQSDVFTNRVTAESVGIAYPAIAETKLGAFDVVIPPLSEQTAIVEYLDRATTDIDTTITRAEREIELLDEYRTRLIADVVTGKLDVREAAAALPEVDPLATSDELDDTKTGESGHDDIGVAP